MKYSYVALLLTQQPFY